MNTKQVGSVTELECITYFMKLGYNVSIPFGENSKYDFILDVGNKLLKIQCKTCRAGRTYNSIVISAQSHHKNSISNKVANYSVTDIDYFATFYQDNCYLIPVEICLSSYKQFNLGHTKNNQTKNVNFLYDYDAKQILNMLP